jgi:hypothetical protein
MSQPNFALQENISKNVVLVDGITRCGKSLFSNVLPTLNNTEQLQFFVLLEHIVPALSLGMINPGYASSSVRTLMNELAYNMVLSRNVNFRPDDQTGVLNHPDAKRYFKRLTREDGDGVVNDLRKEPPFFPFMTHDMMVNLEYFDLLNIDYKMIHISRHPVDMIHSWVKRGWGERFLNDPRSFTLTIDFNGINLPWYCHGVEERWLNYNPLERCAFTVMDLIERTIRQYARAAHPERIHDITFENFVQHTADEMQGIAQFLGTTASFATDQALRNARCPRILDNSERQSKITEMRNGISRELYDKMMHLAECYEKNDRYTM